MNIAICDDEREYRELIINAIKPYFDKLSINVNYFAFDSGEALLESNEAYDLVFLDVEMEGVNGIQVAKYLINKNPNAIIFIVTAYHKYLDEAMDLNLFRYIDKPLSTERLYKSLDRALEIIDEQILQFLDFENNFVKLSKEKIMYVEVSMRRTYIHTDTKVYVCKKPMRFFQKKLTASFFVIPHNSYIVNLNYVKKFSRTEFCMENDDIIPISQPNQHEIRKKFFSFAGEF